MVRIDAKVNERPFPIASLQAKIIDYDADRMFEVLEDFSWEYEKRDLHHWIPLLNHFDDYLEKLLYGRTELDLRDLSKPESDTEFPKRNVLSILTTTCTLLRTCLHKQLYNSLEAISLLLGHHDIEVSEAAMDVMLEYATKKGSMNLSTSLQTWTQRLRSIVMVTCRTEAVPLKTFVSDAKDVKIDDLCPLNMMWPNDLMSQRPSRKGIQASDMSPARDMSATDREATRRIVQARGVDPASTTASDMNLKFYIMIAVRSYRRCQETAYRHFVLRMRMKAMYAFIASSKSSGLRLLTALKRSEPQLLEEVQELILDIKGTPLSVRRAALFGIAALATMHRQARSPALHKLLHSGPSCFFAVILDQVVKWMVAQGSAIDSSGNVGLGVSTNHEGPSQPPVAGSDAAADSGLEPFDVPYVEAFTSVLHNLITLFTAPPSSSNPPAEAWVIPSLLTGLEARAPQFYNAAITMLKMLDVYFEVSGPACTLFLEQGGCAKVLELCARTQIDAESVVQESSSASESAFPPTDTGVVPARLRNLMKAAVNVYFQARYSQGHDGGAEEADFLALSRICCKIMLNARHYGGPLLHTFMRVILDMIHTEPTHFAVCFDGGMPAAFVQMLRDGVLPDANVVSSVPMMLEAFCLHEKGRALITEHAPLRALVPLLSHRAYCTPDPAGVSPLQLPDFSSGLEELVRHMPHALCYQAVDAVLAALRVLCAVGGDEEALQCRVGKTPDELKPDQGAAAGATAEAPGGSDSAAGASASAAEGQAADTVVALSPGNPAIQQGWLPGIGPSGVVNEWSHWEAKPQKLEAMLNNAVHILDMMMTLSSSHIGIKALDDKGCFDLLLRLHNMPRMPPALILDRSVRASLLPTQVLRASQVSIVTRIAPLTMDALNTHVQQALDEMAALSAAGEEATGKSAASALPYSAPEATASAVARAVSTLALATELVRLLPSVLEQLTVPTSDGQSIMSKITAFDLAVKSLHPSAQEWIDSPDAKSTLNAQQAKIDAERGWAAALPGAVKPEVATKVAASLWRVSPKEPRAVASKTSTTAPLLQLPSLLQNAEHNVRLFHAAVCKCVHHPTTRYRRGTSSPATPAADPATGCILTPHTHRALAFLAQGRKHALDSAAAIRPADGFDSCDARTLIRVMQRLAVCGEDTRVCLYEMRRKEYYSLMISYLHAVGGFESLAERFSDAIAAACAVLRKAAEAKAAESSAAQGPSRAAPRTQTSAANDSAEAAAVPESTDGAAMDAEDTPGATAATAPSATATASRSGGAAASNAKSWADAASVAAPMLSTFLTLFSLLLHQRSLMQQPSASLMGLALPDVDGPADAAPARPAGEVVHEIQGIALRAVLQLWESLSAGASVAPGVPPALLSHLVSTLSVAYASKADKTVPAPTGGRVNASILDAAPAGIGRNGSPWGPARNLVRPAFVPSESSISALSDGMGFPRDQVEFVMNRISSNEVPLLANYFLEHDVESMMRAGQAAAGAGDSARAGSAMPRARGNGPGTASASGETTPAPAAPAAEEGQGDAAVQQPLSAARGPDDPLAQALAQSEKAAAAQRANGSDGAAVELVPEAALPTVADLGAGAMRLCMQNPGHVFLLAQLFQQATHAAPEPAKDWIASELSSLLSVDQAEPGAAGTSKAALAASAPAEDERRRQVFLHLILVCCTKSSMFARHFAAKADLLSVLCVAAIKKVEDIGAKPVPDCADGSTKAKQSVGGIPPWVNCVMGIAVAIARLQPEKGKAEGTRGQTAAQARDSVARSLARHAREVSMGRRAPGSLPTPANDSADAANVQGQGNSEEVQEARSIVNRLLRVRSQSHVRANARRRLYAQLASSDRQAAAADDPAAAAEPEGAATDAASAEAMVTDDGTAGAGDEATGAHKRDLMHTRLNQIFTGNWRPCGLLAEGDQSQLTKLCCSVVTTVQKHALHMPTPALESLSETKMHSSEHPRGAFFATLQLMAQLARSWPNAQAMVAAGLPRCLMSMPAPALFTGALGDITQVLCLLVEDPDVSLPVVMDINVCSLFNKVARADYGRSGSSRTPTLQMRAFISAATSANFVDRDPLQFVHAVSRNCRYAPGDTTSIQLRPALAGIEAAAPASSIVPAKRNGDGSIKARGTSSTVSAEATPTAAASPASSSAAGAADQPLPNEAVQTIRAVVQRLTDSFKACKRQLNRPPRPVAPADYKRRILENAWSLAPSHEAPFMLALSLHALLNFILRYPKALPVIIAESSSISGLPAMPEGSPDVHPLLLLIFSALPPIVWGMHGLSSIYSHFLLATVVRIACALHMRSTEYSSQIVALAMSQMHVYRGSLDANFKPTPDTLVTLATKHLAFLPAGDAMASHRLQLFASILFHMTADGTRCPALSQSAVALVRSAGGVQALPLALEAVNYARKEGRMAAVVLLAVLSRLLRAGQATLPARIASFARQLMRAGRAAASAGDFQESQRALRLAGSLPAFERWTASGGRAEAGTAASPQPAAPLPTDLAAAVLTAISAAANDLTSLHPAMAHLIAGGTTTPGNGDGGRGAGLSGMIQSLRYGVGAADASQAMPLSGLRELFPNIGDDGVAGDGRDGDGGEMDAALDAQLDGGFDADFEEHREYMDSVLEDADQDDDEALDPPQFAEGMNNPDGGHRGDGDSSEDEMHAGNEEDDDEEDDDDDSDGEGGGAAAGGNGDLNGDNGVYVEAHSSDDDGAGDVPDDVIDAMLAEDDGGIGAHDVLAPGEGDEMDLEEAQAQLADMHAAAQELHDHVGAVRHGGVAGEAGGVDNGDAEMAMEETEAMIAEMEADMHANVPERFPALPFPMADDELEEEDAEMAAADQQVQAEQHMADLEAEHDAAFLDDDIDADLQAEHDAAFLDDVDDMVEHPMAMDGMPLHTFPGLGVPSSNEIAAAIGNGGRFFFNGAGGDRGGGAGGERGEGGEGTPAIRARSHFMRLLNNSQFSFEVTDGDAQALTGMEVFNGLGNGLFSRARMQIRVSPVDPRSAGSRAEFARFVTEGLRGASGGTTVAGQLMSRLFDGSMGMGGGPFTSSAASDPAAALLSVGPVPALPLFPAAGAGDAGGSSAAAGGSSHIGHAMRTLYSSGMRALQTVPAGDGTINTEVQRLLLLERTPPDVPAAGSRGSTGVSVMLLSPGGNSAASAGSSAAQAAALTASVLPYGDIGARADGHQSEARSGTGALVRTSALTRSLLQDALAHVPAGVGVGAGPGAPEVSVSQRRFHDMMYGQARLPEHPLTTRQPGGPSVIETAIAEVMTAEDEAASGDQAAQDPSRVGDRGPRLMPLFSPRTRQMAGEELDRNFDEAIDELHRDHGDPALPADVSATFARFARGVEGAPGRPEARSIVQALQDLVQALQGPNEGGAGGARVEGEAAAAADAGRGPVPAREQGAPSGQPDAEEDPVSWLLRMTGTQVDSSGQSISVLLNRAAAQAPAAEAPAADAGPEAPPAAGGAAADTDMADAADEPPRPAAEARQDDVSEPRAASPDGHAPMDGVREQTPPASTTTAAPAEPPASAAAEPAQRPAPGADADVAGATPEATPAAGTSAPAAGATAPSAGGEPEAAPATAAAGDVAATGDAGAPAAATAENPEEGVLTARMRERATAAGLDVSMLEALPSEMVRETLLAYGVDIRDTGGDASEAAAAAEDTRAALEGVIPPELLNEGLQAERDRAARRLREFSGARQRAAAGDAGGTGAPAADGGRAAAAASDAAQDFATMIMSFPTDVREDALASLPADVVEQLPASLRSQAQRLQGRRVVPGRLRETMGHTLGRIGAGVGGVAAHRTNGDGRRGDGALSALLSGTLDRMPAPLAQLPDTAQCEELGVDSVRTLIKLNACAAVLESESSVLSSSSRPDIHDGVTAILVGCLPTQRSVARVCSLFMEAVSSFLVQPRAVAPPSSAPVRRFVLGLDTTRAAMCPQANDAALVLTGLLGMLSDLSKFDGHVAQGLMESTVSEAEGSGKRGRGSEQGTPAVLCLMQLLQSDVGTVSPIARSAILSLLESLLSSVATQHISDTYRRPCTATVRDHATASAAAALAKINAQAASDADMDQGERQAGAAAGEAAANAPEAPATVATPDAGTSAAAGAGPDSASGPVTRRRRRLNSGEDAPAAEQATLATAAPATASDGAGPSSSAATSDTAPRAAAAGSAPAPQKLDALEAEIICPGPPRPSIAALRSLPTAPVVLFTQSLAYKIPSRTSLQQSKAASQVCMYDVSASQKVRRTLVLLCQLSPQLIEPVFEEVVKVFQSVRGGLQGAVHQKPAGGESTSADAEAAAAASAELSASAISQIGSAARVLLEVVATLRTLLTVLQSYSHYAALVRGAVTAAQSAQAAENGTVSAAERARVLTEMELGEVEALPERKVAQAAFAEDVVAGNIARVHGEAHCQLLSHLKSLAESSRASAATAEASTADEAAGGAEAKNGDGAAAAATGTSGASTSKAAAAEERRQSSMTLLIPQAIDAEVQSGPLPQANTLVTKLQGILESGDLWDSVSARLAAAEGSLPKAPANPASRTTRTPLPAVLSALQPLVECYFALCSVCGLLGAPPQPPSFDTVTPLDVEGQTAVHAALPQPESPRATQDVAPTFSQGDRPGSGSCVSSPQRFMERHRVCLNAYLAHDPKLLEGAFAFLLHTPRLIDFANKVAYFRAKVTELKGRERMPPVSIAIHRSRAFEESFRQLKPKPASEMRGPLQVRFHGEEGIDMGGLTREWYEVMAKAICDPNLALFASQPEFAQTYQPSKNAVIQDESMVSFRDYFRFCGRFVGKALLDGQQLSCYFTRSFYKHMLAVPLTLKDLEHVDPDYYKSLQYLLEHDVEEALPDTPFVTEVDFFGRKDLVELKPGGANIMVTNENKQEYANLAARQKMTTSIKEPIEAFQAGLWEVVPLSLLRLLSHAELELLLSGLPDIDVHDLRRNTAYAGGLTATDRLVQWFWSIVEDMDKQDVALLLQFVTGTSKVPLGGFGQLFGIAGEQKFTIQKGNGGPDRLPTAHTCFNQLDLHKYESKEQLRDRLVLAIHEGATGFGFA